MATAQLEPVEQPQDAGVLGGNASHEVSKEKQAAFPYLTPEPEPKLFRESEAEQDDHTQDGVAQVQAITEVWTQNALIMTFVFLWIIAFFDMLTQSTQTQLTPYVTSAFSKHALLSTTSIMSSIIGGVSKLTVAKLINIWGRMEGFAVMVFLSVIGLVMKAVCKNVQTYAAAQTLYWTGHLGITYIMDVVISDMTTLKNRMIIWGIWATPSIATTFAGPAMAQAYLKHTTWRWAFGTFCIVLPVICLPAFLSFFLNHRKAKKLGVLPSKSSGRTWSESMQHYFIEFDVVGLVLCTAAFALILLPFSIASSSAKKWASGSIIAMLVVGVVSMISFVLWERYFAKVQFMPFRYLTNRTILGACICYGVLFLSVYCWDIYFSSYLQVVNRQTVKNAGYILNSYSLCSSVISPLVGYLMAKTGRFKYLAYAAIPFAILGTALLIYFRHPGTHVGYLVMCQIFNGIAGAIIPFCTSMAVMSSVPHNEVAVVLAIHALFGSIGAAIGESISGAIWTNLLPGALRKYLPDELKAQWLKIYDSLTIQLGYEWGSPARNAIIEAYGVVQRKMVIAGAAFVPLMFASIIMWRNIDARTIKQTKGNVF